ncbi:MAG: hypothetical protein ABJC89_04385 [Acidobacteriota bacterium]
MHPGDLESLVDRELRQLPLPKAPLTLLPRVMAAVQHWAGRPWYGRAWFTWPVWGQVASLATLTLLFAGVVAVLPGMLAGAADAAAPVSSVVTGHASALKQNVEIVATAAGVVWRALLGPLMPYAFAVALLMFLACVAFGTAFNHLVLERA